MGLIREEGKISQGTIPPTHPEDDVKKKRGQVPLQRWSWFLSFQNVTANHRANDVIAAEDGPQVLVGRFMYGPLDMVALTGEKVQKLGPPFLGTRQHLGRGLRGGAGCTRWEMLTRVREGERE